MQDDSEKKYSVTVFMSTYNGEKYLQEQIDSILRQKEVQVFLMCISFLGLMVINGGEKSMIILKVSSRKIKVSF